VLIFDGLESRDGSSPNRSATGKVQSSARSAGFSATRKPFSVAISAAESVLYPHLQTTARVWVTSSTKKTTNNQNCSPRQNERGVLQSRSCSRSDKCLYPVFHKEAAEARWQRCSRTRQTIHSVEANTTLSEIYRDTSPAFARISASTVSFGPDPSPNTRSASIGSPTALSSSSVNSLSFVVIT